MIVSALSGVVAQRLVKTICKDCAETREATPVEREIFEQRNQTIDTITFGRGCDVCRHTGYRGRMAIHELIVITEDVRQLMINQASIQEIKRHIKLQGIRFLVDDGLIKVKAGKTTLEEVLRVASINE